VKSAVYESATFAERVGFTALGLAIGLVIGLFATTKRVDDLDKRLTVVETSICSPAGLLQCPAKTKEGPR